MSEVNDTTPSSKPCTKCREVKELADYGFDKRARDGRQSRCRACCNVVAREAYDADPTTRLAHCHEYYAANRAKVRAAQAERYAEGPAAVRAAAAAWAKANPDRRREIVTSWHAANPARVREIRRKWRTANPDATADIAAVRRARIRRAPVVERIYRADVWERDGGICHLCGLPADPSGWHLEHVIPIARGGEHSYRNVAVSHPICNARKGAKAPPGGSP